MKPSNIAKAIAVCARINRPLFIWGGPGGGKSDTVRQAASALSGEYGFLFLDEMNAAPAQTQAALYQLVLDRRVGDYIMPSGWRIVAAGNRSNDRGVVHRMPDPLVDRFFHVDFEVDLNDWCQWALAPSHTPHSAENLNDWRASLRDAVDVMGLPGTRDGVTFYNLPAGLPRNPIGKPDVDADVTQPDGLRPEVIAFIRFRPALLHHHDTARACHSITTPRGWADVSLVLDHAPPEIEHDMIRGRVGDGAAGEFMAFLKLYREMVSPDAILANPTSAKVPTNAAVLYALSEALARRASVKNFDVVLTYAKRMPREYSACLVSSATRITPALCNTHEFIRWASEQK